MTYRLNELPVPDKGKPLMTLQVEVELVDQFLHVLQGRRLSQIQCTRLLMAVHPGPLTFEPHRELHQHPTTAQLQHLVGVTRRLVVVLESEGVMCEEVEAVREALKKLGEAEG